MVGSHKVLFLLIIAAAIFVRSYDIFRPIDHSSWREADVGSIARNYALESMNPLYPRIDWRGQTDGRVESEFPILPYLIAITYKIFGLHDYFGRIWAFVFSIVTLWFYFKLVRYLLPVQGAIAALAFFALNPLIIEFSTAIQPEVAVLCFYIAAVYFFERWIEQRSMSRFLPAALMTGMAILAKLSAAHLGLFFLLVLLRQDGLATVRRLQNMLFAVISLTPAILWYIHARRIYKATGNSLGISNEYHWVGPDFFTNRYFIEGILHNEFAYVWGIAGLLIGFYVIGFYAIARGFGDRPVLHSLFWLAACFAFYILAARTTADDWAYYYHIFSVPPAGVLFGFGIAKLVEDIKDSWESGLVSSKSIRNKQRFVLLFLLFGFALGSLLMFQAKHIRDLFQERSQPDENYICAMQIKPVLAPNQLILASGGKCHDSDGFPTAYNASYMFYWLDRKGFNICIEEQTPENLLKFSEMGARYFVAEKPALNQIEGFESLVRREFPVLKECGGVIVFDLSPGRK